MGPAVPFPGPRPSPGNLAGMVPGVTVPGVSPVAPAPPAGHPAPLPFLPQAPVPAGFPNPFATRQVPVAAPGMPVIPPGAVPNPGLLPPGAGGAMPPGGGMMPVPGPVPGALPGPLANGAPVGPAGMMPVPVAGAMPGPALGMGPALAWPQPHPGAGLPGPWPGSVPSAALPAAPAVAFPAAPSAAPGPPSPSVGVLQALAPWVQLAGQMLQSAPVRQSLGPALDSLQARPDLAQLVLGVATGVLTSAECQSALRDLLTGATDSARFGELFASRLRSLLEMHGLVARQPR